MKVIMKYGLNCRYFSIFEYVDGSPATVEQFYCYLGESTLKEISDFKTKTKEELIAWVEKYTDFKSFSDTDIINSNGKISASHVKVVDAWIKES